MSIKQFNGTYFPQEDRLIFRFNTADDSEYRLWFTRRVTLFILAAANHLIQSKLEKQHTPDVAKAISEFERESLKKNVQEDSQAGQSSSYEPGSRYPLGADPLLVLDAKCTQHREVGATGTSDALSIDLTLPGGGNLNLRLAGQTLTGMCLLLDQLRAKAGWGLVSGDVNELPEQNALSASQKSIQIH